MIGVKRTQDEKYQQNKQQQKMRNSLTESSHPHVAGNEQPYQIVSFRRFIVVIPHKHYLHPSFPFLRLVAIQQLVRWAHASTVWRAIRRKVACVYNVYDEK